MVEIPSGIEISSRPGRPRLWMPPLAALLCVAASCLIRLHTGGLKVDENYPSLGVSIATVFIFLAALALSLLFYARTCLNERASPIEARRVRNAAYAACIIAAFMLPMLSNDVFSVLAYGDLALRGVDIFAYPADLSPSVFSPYVGEAWKSAPCVYGPLTLVIAAAAAWLGMGDVALALLAFKLFALAASLLLVHFAFRYALDHPDHADWRTLALLTLSPVLWLQGAGQAHNDLFCGTFLMMGVFHAGRERTRLAAFWFACAALVKLSALVGVLFFAAWLWNLHRADPRRLLTELAAAAGIMAAAAVILYALVWQGPQTLTGPVAFLAEKRPSNSLVMLYSEVAVWLKMFLQSLWSHGMDALEGLGALRSDRVLVATEKRAAWGLFKMLFMGAGLALMGLQASPFLRRLGPQEALAAFARVSVVATTIAPAVFFPWYLLVVLPFFIVRMSREWTIWLALVSVLSHGQNLPRLTDHASLVYRLLDPLFTYATIFLFLYAFGRRFFARDRPGPRAAAPGAQPAEIA
jgi:hypothetical protein